MATVAFDESGNTGQHLLDPAQPVFALGSVYLSAEEAEEVRALGSLRPDQEAKFTDLKRRPVNQDRIIRMLESNLLTPDTVKTCVYHKRYMIVTKIVDVLVEDFLYERGVDLYKHGANIGLSNMWYHVIPAFCGAERFEDLLSRFVAMIRNKDRASVDAFYTAVWRLRRTTANPEFRRDTELLLHTQEILADVLATADVTLLDPAVPAFLQLASEWNEKFHAPFRIVHDASKSIEHEREILEYFMAEDEPEVLVGYDRRKARFPVRATGIEFVDSAVVKQVQIADIVSGATVYLMRGYADATFRGEFWERLNETRVRDWLTSVIWPSLDVTPEQLGTAEEGGINMVDYSAELIARQREKKAQRRDEQ